MSFTRVFENEAGLARGAAEVFVQAAAGAIAQRCRFLVALSGGSTPRSAYELLSSPAFVDRVDWPKVHVFWGDERMVPPDHPGSNYRMVHEALLAKIPIPAANIHPIRGELTAEEAAKAYAADLTETLGVGGRFDLVLLGMGDDGHTASLFPGTSALAERVAPVVPVYIERMSVWRVTLTLPVINAARSVVFLIRGSNKRETLARVRAGERLPAAFVQPHSGQLLWLIDREATPA